VKPAYNETVGDGIFSIAGRFCLIQVLAIWILRFVTLFHSKQVSFMTTFCFRQVCNSFGTLLMLLRIVITKGLANSSVNMNFQYSRVEFAILIATSEYMGKNKCLYNTPFRQNGTYPQATNVCQIYVKASWLCIYTYIHLNFNHYTPVLTVLTWSRWLQSAAYQRLVAGWGGSTNSVEDRGNGDGGSSPLVRGSAQFAQG
jgi:hypothetical protein